MLACTEGRVAVAKLLLERGAAVDAVDGNDCTPLLIACLQGRESVAEILLDHGADINR